MTHWVGGGRRDEDGDGQEDDEDGNAIGREKEKGRE